MSKILYRDGHVENKFEQAVIVEETVDLEQKWVVRLIKDEGFKKSCIGEEEFHNRPTKEQVLWCLLKHKDASFACVLERYFLEKELPFA